VSLLDLGQNIDRSIYYAKKMLSDLGRLAILVILNMIPVVNWIVVGYIAKVVKETPGSDSPPKIENYGALWVSGLKTLVVVTIYMIAPAIPVGIGVYSLFASFEADSDSTPTINGMAISCNLFLLHRYRNPEPIFCSLNG